MDFKWAGSASEKVLVKAWYRETSIDPYIPRIEVVNRLSPQEKSILAEENRNLGAAYRTESFSCIFFGIKFKHCRVSFL